MRLISIVTVLAIGGPAHAGGAFLPPLEVDLGQAWLAALDGGAIRATEVLVGLSWASVVPHSTPVDFRVGWHGSFVGDPAEGSPALIARRLTDPMDVQTASGAFVELDVRTLAGDHWRTWLGLRGELLGTQGVGVLGGAGRLTAELWHPVRIGGRGGGIIGSVALELWAEIGVRERVDRSLASGVASGIGLRMPLVVAAGP